MSFLAGRLGKVVCALAIILLIILALAADHATAVFSESEHVIAHTHDVRTALTQLRTRMFQAQAAGLDYIVTGEQAALVLFDRAKQEAVLFLRPRSDPGATETTRTRV